MGHGGKGRGSHHGHHEDSKFQIKLNDRWTDYQPEEDKIMKRAYMAGFPNAKFQLRGQRYEYNFQSMVQKNLDTNKTREIRPPTGRAWQPPSEPICPQGKTICVKVQRGWPGTTVQVRNPQGGMIAVNVPRNAKIGQAMLVPLPNGPSDGGDVGGGGGGPAAAPSAPPAAGGGGGDGWSTGGKVAAVGGGAVLGAAAVGGALLGVHVAEHGVDATVDAAGDVAGTVGEAIGDAAGDVGDWAGDAFADAGDAFCDAGDAMGDFIMDLF